MVRRSRFIPILIVLALAASLPCFPAPVAAGSGAPRDAVVDLPLMVIPAAHSIFLAWPPVAGAQYYIIEKMDPFELIFSKLDILGGAATSYLVIGLAAGSHYQLRVQAYGQQPEPIASGNVEIYTMPYQAVLPLVVVSN